MKWPHKKGDAGKWTIEMIAPPVVNFTNILQTVLNNFLSQKNYKRKLKEQKI